jgi:hypothetical protein
MISLGADEAQGLDIELRDNPEPVVPEIIGYDDIPAHTVKQKRHRFVRLLQHLDRSA